MNAQDSDAFETFEAHTSLEQVSIPVPLPTEVPPPPNLSQLPAHILHSGTVETLIGQNEDLMARLKVNIRRNSMLEQRILQQDETIQEISNLNNSLVAQLQVTQEKDRILREKSRGFDMRQNELEEEIELLKVKLAAAEDRSFELHAGLEFENAYRRRVRRWVRPAMDQLRTRNTLLDRELNARNLELSELRSRFADTISHMQTQQRVHSSDQMQLVDQYESRMRATEAELTRLRAESKLLRDKSVRLDEAVSAKAEIENRNIALERKVKEIENSLGLELRSFQEQAAQYRIEAKTLAAELNTTRSAHAQATLERDTFKNDLARIQDQLESLQTVWSETQKKVEASKLQQDALNKLNQELSRQLKESRKAVNQQTAQETALTLSTESQESPARDNANTHEKLNRIDSLLAEIESGFSSGRGVEILEQKEKTPPTLTEAAQSPTP